MGLFLIEYYETETVLTLCFHLPLIFSMPEEVAIVSTSFPHFYVALSCFLSEEAKVKSSLNSIMAILLEIKNLEFDLPLHLLEPPLSSFSAASLQCYRHRSLSSYDQDLYSPVTCPSPLRHYWSSSIAFSLESPIHRSCPPLRT